MKPMEKMTIPQNSRQVPSSAYLIRPKEYCDLLWAWLQCNSERINPHIPGRRVSKKIVKWTAIEKDFTRTTIDGKVEKIMGRKAIAKYFNYLIEQEMVIDEDDGWYYLKVLDASDANLIEFNTLSKLMNVLQKNSISVYVYLFNRYYANGLEPFIVTMSQIKEFIGVATTTTSNNIFISDTIDILQRLKLLDYTIQHEGEKTIIKMLWVKNKLEDTVK